MDNNNIVHSIITTSSIILTGIIINKFISRSSSSSKSSKLLSASNEKEQKNYKCPMGYGASLTADNKCPMGFGLEAKEEVDLSTNSNNPLSLIGCPAGYTNSSFSSDELKLIRPKKGGEPVYYHDYLKLDSLLNCQIPKSLQSDGRYAHDEMLFIIIHQTYELWFKEILHDLSQVASLFTPIKMPEDSIGTIVMRLQRVVKILQVLVSQLDILETMSPVDFLDFRDFLFPASGFESVQFRLLENTLGLRSDSRMNYHAEKYSKVLKPEHQEIVTAAEEKTSLFELIERWLERLPFVADKVEGEYNFWEEYQTAVKSFFETEKEILANSAMSDKMKTALTDDVQFNLSLFDRIFDEEKYNILKAQKKTRLKWKAVQAALFICLYKEQPLFQVPYQLITLLLDIDEQLAAWRAKHAMMVHRMLGSKLGTGGSSGFDYLKSTVNAHKIFADFGNLSVFFIPRSELPVLPASLKARLNFSYN